MRKSLLDDLGIQSAKQEKQEKQERFTFKSNIPEIPWQKQKNDKVPLKNSMLKIQKTNTELIKTQKLKFVRGPEVQIVDD